MVQHLKKNTSNCSYFSCRMSQFTEIFKLEGLLGVNVSEEKSGKGVGRPPADRTIAEA